MTNFRSSESRIKSLRVRFSNNAVRADELPGHLRVPAGLVDQREVEGNLPPQIHLIVCDTLGKRGRASV